ncbi:hypothetical protein Tco_1109444 [Tanacetum coccineum]
MIKHRMHRFKKLNLSILFVHGYKKLVSLPHATLIIPDVHRSTQRHITDGPESSIKQVSLKSNHASSKQTTAATILKIVCRLLTGPPLKEELCCSARRVVDPIIQNKSTSEEKLVLIKELPKAMDSGFELTAFSDADHGPDALNTNGKSTSEEYSFL